MSAARLHARLEAKLGRLRMSLELDTGLGTLAVVGPNGAGKSSLLSLLLGVLPVERGYVALGERVLLDTSASVRVPVEQRRLGYVPQSYGLFPHLTVEGNLAFALASALPTLPRRKRRSAVEAALDELDLVTHARRYPGTLSGGERQRAAIARAICAKPEGLLLDEPLSALDVLSRREVIERLAAYLERLALPTVVVTHDALEARTLGARIAVLEDGKLTQCGTWDELTARPASVFVERFVASACR